MKFQRTCWRLVNIGLTSFLRLLMYSDHRKIPILYLEKNNFMRICLCWQWKHALQRKERRLVKVYLKGPSIKYVRKISRKTNISNPQIRTRTFNLCTHWKHQKMVQKEKVEIAGQISIAAKKKTTRKWPQILIMESK